MDEMDYIYLGDRLTRPELRRMPCRAVRRSDGKCVIIGRLLRKIKK